MRVVSFEDFLKSLNVEHIILVCGQVEPRFSKQLSVNLGLHRFILRVNGEETQGRPCVFPHTGSGGLQLCRTHLTS